MKDAGHCWQTFIVTHFIYSHLGEYQNASITKRNDKKCIPPSVFCSVGCRHFFIHHFSFHFQTLRFGGDTYHPFNLQKKILWVMAPTHTHTYQKRQECIPHIGKQKIKKKRTIMPLLHFYLYLLQHKKLGEK